jgi:hypothetical protein
MIELSVLIAFAVLFINATTWEGMIFDEVANYLDTKLPEWISKPLYGCPICQSFWWGSAFYVFYRGVEKEMLIVVFAAAGINAFIINLNKHIKEAGCDE